MSFCPFMTIPINSKPNDKILDLSKLKAFADEKIDVTYQLKFHLRTGSVEDTVRNG